MKRNRSNYSVLCMMICILLFAVPAPVQAIPTVSLELPVSQLFVGDTFDINVVVDGITDLDWIGLPDELLAFGFDVDYNGAEFTYNGATIASPYIDDSASASDTDVVGIAFPGLGGDDILLASLSFTSLSSGNFTLGILSDMLDLNEGAYTFIYDDFTEPRIDLTSSIDININSSAVPEPATMLLLGTGLISIAGIRRKKGKNS